MVRGEWPVETGGERACGTFFLITHSPASKAAAGRALVGWLAPGQGATAALCTACAGAGARPLPGTGPGGTATLAPPVPAPLRARWAPPGQGAKAALAPPVPAPLRAHSPAPGQDATAALAPPVPAPVPARVRARWAAPTERGGGVEVGRGLKAREGGGGYARNRERARANAHLRSPSRRPFVVRNSCLRLMLWRAGTAGGTDGRPGGGGGRTGGGRGRGRAPMPQRARGRGRRVRAARGRRQTFAAASIRSPMRFQRLIRPRRRLSLAALRHGPPFTPSQFRTASPVRAVMLTTPA